MTSCTTLAGWILLLASATLWFTSDTSSGIIPRILGRAPGRGSTPVRFPTGGWGRKAGSRGGVSRVGEPVDGFCAMARFRGERAKPQLTHEGCGVVEVGGFDERANFVGDRERCGFLVLGDEAERAGLAVVLLRSDGFVATPAETNISRIL